MIPRRAYGYDPVTFTAPCPTCSADATWIAAMVANGDGQTKPHHHIECVCGPCPCLFCEPDEVVAA